MRPMYFVRKPPPAMRILRVVRDQESGIRYQKAVGE